jgi:hypothetical protein
MKQENIELRYFSNGSNLIRIGLGKKIKNINVIPIDLSDPFLDRKV